MGDDFDDLVLVFLRRLDAKLDRLADDMADVRRLLTALEDRMTSIEQTLARPYRS